MIDEGYVKFQAQWNESAPLATTHIQELNVYRQQLYDLGLIGAYANGIGYGNISKKHNAKGHFIISGTATGNLNKLNTLHYALVTKVASEHNKLWCEGPIMASSESMSHAAIYEHCPEILAVVHVHHLALWKKLMHQVPTTDASAPYGSPEMVKSIVHLLNQTNLREEKIFVMEGHEEGIFTFGESLEQATEILLKYFYALR